MNNTLYFSKSKDKELKFVEAYLLKYPSANVIYASKLQDMVEHWDVEIDKLKYDVKGLKNINRNDLAYNENFHFIEIKNVKNDLGWLYGKADRFSFELLHYWVVVDKTKLQDFIKNHVDKTQLVTKPELYKLYRRKHRQDLITIVTSYDLCYLSSFMLSKS